MKMFHLYHQIIVLSLLFLQPVVSALKPSTNSTNSSCSFAGGNSLVTRGNLCGASAQCDDPPLSATASVTSWYDLPDGNFLLHIEKESGAVREIITTSGHAGCTRPGRTIYNAMKDNGSELALRLSSQPETRLTGNLLSQRLSDPVFNHVSDAFLGEKNGVLRRVILLDHDPCSPRDLQSLMDADSAMTPMRNDVIVEIFVHLVQAIKIAHDHDLYNFNIQPTSITILPGNQIQLYDFDTVTTARISCIGQAPGQSSCTAP